MAIKTIIKISKVLVDSFAYYSSVALAIFLYNSDVFGVSRSVWDINPYAVVMGNILFIIIIANNQGYREFLDFARLSEMTSLLRASFQTVLMYAVLFFLFQLIVPRILGLYTALLLIIVPLISRMVLINILYKYASYPAKQRAVVYGAGEIGRTFVETIEENGAAVEVVGFIDDNPEVANESLNPVPLLGTFDDLNQLVEKFSIKRLIVAIRDLSQNKMTDLITISNHLGLNLSFVPRIELFTQNPLKLRDFAGLTLEPSSKYRQTFFYGLSKRIFDIFVSLVVLILFSPIFLIISLLLKLDSPGPIIFKHKRVGLDGKEFLMYKFRSMYIDTERYAHCPESGNDPRITKAGKWVRKSSIDEVPQLFNILKGDMSIVGPRPEMPFIVENYNEIEKQRLNVKPGLTGLWQISPTRNSEISHNLEYDFYYIENCSLTLDLVIVFMTVFWVLRGVTH